VSGLRRSHDRYDCESAERQLLLALSELRGSVDPCSTRESGGRPVAAVTGRADGESPRTRTIRALRELIAALERRAPQVGRAGEVAIAHAAAVLKTEALKRLTELEREAVDGPEAVPLVERPAHDGVL
jgi:hypothetical protein